MAEELFTTIAQNWAHYLERDIPRDAPMVQVMAMKHAFASGAISGLMLACLAMKDCTQKQATANLRAHIEGMKNLCPTEQGAK